MKKHKLLVCELPVRDCWKDMTRIPGQYRGNGRSRIHRNTICKITIGDQQKLLVVRGWKTQEAKIALDSSTRDDLGVVLGENCEVTISPIKWYQFGYWRWAWNASDPAYRIPSQISIVSLILGVIGFVLGAMPLLSRCVDWLAEV